MLSRIIWKLITGLDPDCIDHIDRNAQNNSWSNLRECSHSQNTRNKSSKKDRTILKGAYLRAGGVFSAQIAHCGKQIYLGRFATEVAAHAAYCDAARKLHGEFWSPG